ncbi:MAG: arylsulfatase [Verrucomicrobiota bacterium]
MLLKLALPILSLTLALSNLGAEAPNIVLVMADDMGYTDIGCYGSEIETPVLDKLAANGVRFTQFYNTSRCCPTRASLLTGLYSHQAGIGLMTGDRGYEAYRGDLNKRCVTLAEVLRPAGYRTYMSGKWHVTRHIAPTGPMHNWPRQRGFDRFYGTIIGAGSFYDPTTLCRGNTYITPENDSEYKPEAFHYTDAISDNAVTYIRDHFEDHEKDPFFLYVAYTSAHWPMHAPEDIVEKYKGRYDGGFDPIRQARYEKAKKVGVINGRWKMSEGAASWAANKHKAWDIRCMEVYGAMVDQMDQGIGRIVRELETFQALDNTLFIYLQDNGGCAEPFGRRSNAEQIKKANYKPFGPDGLQPQIWPPMQTRDGRPVRTGPEVMPGGEDSYVAYGLGWANASNTPFRGYKHDGYEGGITTPFIVHWPKGIPEEQRNAVVHHPSHLIDLMPTFVEVGKANYPGEHAGETIQPMEGQSLVPALHGNARPRKKALGFEHHGNLALRDGDWKIVSVYSKKQPIRWELYNMVEDRTELNDLAKKNPTKLKELKAKWQVWADRVGVQPWPIKNKKRS